ncbi:MAG TPA: hypothetical protein VH518_06370, partial [Tepidisphaeraceae bacterium]
MRAHFPAMSLLACGFLVTTGWAATLSIDAGGASASVDDAGGAYRVSLSDLHFDFAGSVAKPLRDVRKASGTDKIGEFAELSFDWDEENPITGTIRTYAKRPLVLFSQRLHNGATTRPAPFPNFDEIPKPPLHVLSHQNEVFARPAYGAAVQTSTPWLLFDDSARAVILSPASNFMVANMLGDGTSTIGSGLDIGLTDYPIGFTHRALLAYGTGIGATYRAWGSALTDLSGKKRPPNDADLGLKYLGYWTDNGAAYYYNYDPDKGYAATLLAVRDEMRRLEVPVKYMQLDSWWYQKTTTNEKGVDTGQPKNKNLPKGTWNAYGGLLKYEAHPDLFPDGLAGFQKALGLPLITHNRWIDAKSPYRDKYQVAGVAPVDPKYWDEIASYLQSCGVMTYEQDWLNILWNNSPQLRGSVQLSQA